MITNLKLVTVTIPVYNSEETLEELFSRIQSVFINLKLNFEVIFIEDGSTDESWNTIQKLSKVNQNIKGIKLNGNYGQHAALFCGFSHSNGDVIITIDDDLQNPPEEIPKLLEAFQNTKADVVYGIPKDKKHTFIRNAGSKALTVTSPYKNQEGSSFRLLKYEFIKKIIVNYRFNHIYLDSILSWNTSNFTKVYVEHHTRKKGKSGYTLFKLFKVYVILLINYGMLPLKLLVYGGIIISFLSFILGIFFIYKKITLDVPLGYTSIIVAILFSSSLVIIGLGVLGIYIHKLYEFSIQKPNYFIEKIISKDNDN